MALTPRRSAIASVELVMVLPILLALAAGLFVLGRAIVRKESTVTESRNKTWIERNNAAPGDILQLSHDPQASAVGERVSKPVQVGAVAGGGTIDAVSHNQTIARPWDAEDIPFRAGRAPLVPHLEELGMIARNLTQVRGLLESGVNGFGAAFDPGANPVLAAAARAGQTGNQVVKFWSNILKTLVAPLKAARAVVRMLEIAARWARQRSLANFYAGVIRAIDVGIVTFDALHTFARGMPGPLDIINLIDRLRRALP